MLIGKVNTIPPETSAAASASCLSTNSLDESISLDVLNSLLHLLK